jgi:hypothetical protein
MQQEQLPQDQNLQTDNLQTNDLTAQVSIQAPGHEKNISPLTNLIFRQSLIKDIMTCPKMASYKWVYKFNSMLNSDPHNGSSVIDDEYGDIDVQFMSAILGSAGHDVIEMIHKTGKLTHSYTSVLSMFEEAFWARINDMTVSPQTNSAQQSSVNDFSSPDSTKLQRLPSAPITIKSKSILVPNPSKGFNSIEEEFEAKSFDYASMINNYQEFHRNPQNIFIPTMQERMFAFAIEYKGQSFVFSGTMDQVGAYRHDGAYVVRDIKFRENAFKPNFVELSLDPQLIIYAAALKYGFPACRKCCPKYEEDQMTVSRNVIYNGPCDNCKKLIKTINWPGMFPSRCELVWMRDLIKLKKGTTRGNIARKKGDFKGKCIYRMFVPNTKIDNYLVDILEYCYRFRNGMFVRNPGSHCIIFCPSASQCRKELYLDDCCELNNTADMFDRELNRHRELNRQSDTQQDDDNVLVSDDSEYDDVLSKILS